MGLIQEGREWEGGKEGGVEERRKRWEVRGGGVERATSMQCGVLRICVNATVSLQTIVVTLINLCCDLWTSAEQKGRPIDAGLQLLVIACFHCATLSLLWERRWKISKEEKKTRENGSPHTLSSHFPSFLVLLLSVQPCHLPLASSMAKAENWHVPIHKFSCSFFPPLIKRFAWNMHCTFHLTRSGLLKQICSPTCLTMMSSDKRNSTNIFAKTTPHNSAKDQVKTWNMAVIASRRDLTLPVTHDWPPKTDERAKKKKKPQTYT